MQNDEIISTLPTVLAEQTYFFIFEAADLAKMSTAQTAALNAVSPIILDLDGNGVRTLAASEGVVFDVAASGSTAGRVGWATGHTHHPPGNR